MKAILRTMKELQSAHDSNKPRQRKDLTMLQARLRAEGENRPRRD